MVAQNATHWEFFSKSAHYWWESASNVSFGIQIPAFQKLLEWWGALHQAGLLGQTNSTIACRWDGDGQPGLNSTEEMVKQRCNNKATAKCSETTSLTTCRLVHYSQH